MKYSSRVFLWAPLAVFLILLAIAGIRWWIAADALADWLDARNGRQVMPGVTLQFGARHITGFPFSLDTEFHDLVLTVETGAGPRRWSSEKFAMHRLIYGRDDTIFEAAGHQSLAWPGGGLAFAVGSLHASAIRSDDALARFDLDVVGFGSKPFTAQRLQLHIRRGTADRLDTLFRGEGVRPTPNTCPRLGDQITEAELSGSVTRADAFSRLVRGDESLAAALARWRAVRGEYRRATASFVPLQDAHGKLKVISAEDLIPRVARMICLLAAR